MNKLKVIAIMLSVVSVCTVNSFGAYAADKYSNVENKTISDLNVSSVELKTEQAVYDLGTESVKVAIKNNSDERKGYRLAYRVEKFENNKWTELKLKSDVIPDVYCTLNPHSTNYETYDLSDLEDFDKLTAGKYRIVVGISKGEYAAEFELKKAKADVELETEKPIYDLGTKEVKVAIKNNGDEEKGYGLGYTVEKFVDNKWTEVELKDFGVDEIYCILKPHSTNYETYDLTNIKNFDKLEAGKYRIVINVSGEKQAAEFELKQVKADVELKTEKPVYDLGTESVKVAIKNNSDKEKGYTLRYRVEKFENNKWTELELKSDVVVDLYCIINPNDTSYETYDLSDLKDFDKLTAGKYRIVVGVSKNEYAAEFELKEAKADVEVKAEKPVYDLGTKKVKVAIKNNSDEEQGYCVAYKVEKFEDNKWTELELKNNSFNDLYCIVNPQSTCYRSYKLTNLKDFNKLTAGKYRIVISVSEKEQAAEFELK